MEISTIFQVIYVAIVTLILFGFLGSGASIVLLLVQEEARSRLHEVQRFSHQRPGSVVFCWDLKFISLINRAQTFEILTS